LADFDIFYLLSGSVLLLLSWHAREVAPHDEIRIIYKPLA